MKRLTLLLFVALLASNSFGQVKRIKRLTETNSITGADLIVIDDQIGAASYQTMSMRWSNLVAAIKTIVTVAPGSNVTLSTNNGTTNVIYTVASSGGGGGIFTNDVTATLQTTDITTNTLYSFTPLDNSVVRVSADVIAYNSTSSAGYGKTANFKRVAGTITQIGGTATLGSGEDDAQFACDLDISGSTVRIRVAGNTGKTVNWSGYIRIMYSQ